MSRLKGALLFLLPLPLLFGALIGLGAGRLDAFLGDGAGFVLFMVAASLTRRGILSAQSRQTPRFARLERFPLKTIGGLLTGFATGLTAFVAVGHGLALSLTFAALALLGFHLVYGLEPLGRPRPFDLGDERARKVADALAEAERKLIELERAATTIANPELKLRLQRIGRQGRVILNQIADRPTDLFRARKFLNVYLEGVQQVADGYARTHRLADSRELEQNFRTVLATVEEVFDEQHRRLLKTDLMDLDVQIEVLKKQLTQL
ncbi:5-bromo-4-chloroindolyl phosphate hydrolysis family protein [Thiocystis violascens]|uniref:5-bromo-4-chloroindolyl phosphate hydrolysis protein n=1 Tax=Thiocystis violascens (strain ATCC 17096 / DSM 198 / 6111) TaxID=765911 RepID=I3YGK8_THIV6|nr:5-bromo-4-chloroindolyl phosphate hydrolysis family protein [Thiocystis violascens]AFL76126.1 5-bromo-4-chloroindolyl phosphate hydrolysis protein [Thiocystis violascens DSM 198]